MDQPKREPSPWLSPALTSTAIVVAAVWAYIQMRHWKEPGIDAMPIAINVSVTLLLWLLLVAMAVSNLRDAHRAKSLLAQIATIKNESQTQIAHYKGLADQNRQRTEQATRERSEFQGSAYDAAQLLTGCNTLVEQQISTIHRLEGELSEYRMQAEAAKLKTPSGLRKCVAALAGSLFSILLEIGEKLEPPILTSDRYGEALISPSDPRITTRASERKIEDRLKDAYLRAGDIGVLPECVSWSTSIEDVGEVRARIGDLRILGEALMRRFPDLPTSATPAVL